LITDQTRVGAGQLALRRFESGLPGIYLRSRSKVPPLGIINFLLGHNPGLGFKDVVQARVLQVQGLVLRLVAAEFVRGAVDLALCRFDLGLILLQLGLQFRDFQSGHHLALSHAAAIVNVEFVDVARLFCENVDLLKWHQLRRKSDLAAQGFLDDLGYTDCGGGVIVGLGA